jgi:hypothetical protein
MNGSLALILVAVALAAPHGPAVAGARTGGGSLAAPSTAGTATNGTPYATPYATGIVRPDVTPRNYTPTPQAAQPLGNFMYLGNGMVVPRSMNYFFTWQGRPCQTLNGTTFCQ